MDRRTDLLTGRPASEDDRPPERADAARNRAKVLRAAAGLFATRDPRTVTMDDIARAAGVGRGTLYRRYPDTGSIAVALLDEHERDLQERLLRGEPPLGPGAPPGERLAAFYAAMVALLEAHGHLLLGAESGSSRFTTGAYGFWRAHLRALLVAGDVPDPDAMTDALLAPLSAEVYAHQRERGLSPERIAAALAELTRRTLPGATPEA
ncbi:TetR/AcrR family transcriptional regulator [Spongiactinospora sp. TRM90649]|uniref:TetR/AcrR family transcriptional regulator n=1 Tax=Spongiactinospora sp. TRM90649 TaxID=3031114 RepID=UPI0023F6242F|nr:TetR/AcrR family transcriptional regulator [Spongiactinospora sp. TRM90649]MDF5758259.1 helix-turn-helix domain containing protein [Spongiactinospora sp. TRM90649]